jgi:membrane protein implicated in regulation of membrane protease activity
VGLELLKEPVIAWFFIGLVCIVAEFALPGLIIVFFGAGAWGVALILLAVDLNLFLQLLVFIFSSVAALWLLRRRFVSKGTVSGDMAEEFIGASAQVREPLSRGQPGKVYFKGTVWKAETQSQERLAVGQYVQITGMRSIVLIVEPFNHK